MDALIKILPDILGVDDSLDSLYNIIEIIFATEEPVLVSPLRETLLGKSPAGKKKNFFGNC